MITSQISKVLRYALNTFPVPTEKEYFQGLFSEKLNKLKTTLDKTTATDIGFHDKYMSIQFWESENQAPVGYIDIYEDINVTLGVFILKPGMRMPLHDHPHMHGLLKVIAGQVRIHSYTVLDEEDYILSPEKIQSAIITAQKNPILTANAHSDSVHLQPKLGNLHEIVCDEDSAAAFIDVLSPPYDTLIRVDKSLPHVEDDYYSYLPRKCRFFEIVEQAKDDLVKLKTCTSPSWFWTSREDYLGPKVVDRNNENTLRVVQTEERPNAVESEDSVSSRSGSDTVSNYSNSNIQ